MTKAVRIHVNGGPEVLRYEDVTVPPPGAGEARVRQSAIGVNFSDINVRRGGFYIARPQQFPLIPGNEAAGVVTLGAKDDCCRSVRVSSFNLEDEPIRHRAGRKL